MDKEYENLRLDVLRRLIDDRGIECKDKKDDMINNLKLFDEGKYVRETTYKKEGEGFIVGIDITNKKHLQEIAKLIDKKEAKTLNRYCDNRLQYYSNQKLL
jgi:Na+-transporting NADH:ubiquinone oxidoreductase subunit NqrA